MKKRIFSIVLVISMLAGLWVMPAYAEVGVENITPAEGDCPCGCGKTLDAVEWKVWTGDPREGHYYLDGDYTQAVMATVLSDTTVVLDLRGCTITTASTTRLFLVNGYLHVLDTVGGGRMMAKTPKGEDGGVVCVEENESLRPAFYFYSGTITPDKGSAAAACGGLVYAGNGATFRMTGGVLMNGHAETAYGGGAVGTKHSSSTIEILGGKILNCSTKTNGGSLYSSGTVRVENCYISGGVAGNWGGNIHISGTSGKLTVKNAVITNGVSNGTTTGNKYGGGNINVYSGATANISDSVISGGYAACAGGNICLGRGTTTIKNTTVTGGSCATFGENIYGALSTATGIIDGGIIDGGFHQGSSKLTLKGNLKVGITGLRLGSGTLTATGLTSGAEVFVYGNKTMTGNSAYFKPANRASITVSGNSLTVAMAEAGKTGFCSHCNTQAVWQPYGTEGAIHTYLTADLADAAQTEVTSALVVDLCGFGITATGRAFNIAAGGSLTVIDSVGGGKITGSGVDGENGGVFYNAGTLKLLAGNYAYTKKDGAQPLGGGIIYNAGTLECRNAILNAAAFSATAADAKGGAVCMADGETVSLTMDGCFVAGGTVYNGGSLNSAYKNTAILTNSHFVGGKAVSGGNVYAYHGTGANAGSLTITGCRMVDGVAEDLTDDADNYGGNLYIGRYTATVTDCLLVGGDAQYGGNLNISGSTDVQVADSYLIGGSAYRGGNIYLPSNTSKGSLEGCVLTGGTATSNGGNLTLNNGYVTILGGEVSYGSAPAGGNINAGSNKGTGLTMKADSKGNVPLVCHGTATTGNGGNLNVKNIATITDAFIHSGKAALGNDLYVSGTETALTLGAGVTGDIRMNTSATLLTDNVYGGAISNITCQATNATFCLDGSYGDCGITVENNTMYVAVASVESADGTDVWYRSNAEAVAACKEGSFVKIFTDCELELTKDLYLDINGHNVTVTGDYTVYGMDSSGDEYQTPEGSLTGGAAKTYDVTYAPNGKTYIAVAGETTTYHRLEMALTGVNIRPSVDGLYYTAKWSCDDTLAGLINTYGVAVSTEDMPDSDFSADAGNLWTTFSKDSFVSGETKNSVIISGILEETGKTAEENDARGREAIYAKAYLTFDDGTCYISRDDVRLSLYNVMKSLDKLIMSKPNQYRKYNLSARNFYEKWKELGMGDWDLSKIPDPGEDDVIDLLMVGHSGCYYYVQELYALAAAAGVKIRVCNVYYSGCPLEKHYNWWKAGIGNYQYYETYTEGRKLKGRDVSLEWCLAQQEWDVIMLAMSSGMIRNSATVEIALDNTRLHRTALLDYFREQFPNADLYFRQGWTPEIGYTKNGKLVIEDKASQIAYTDKVRQIVTGICQENNVGRFNLGDAWELCRQTLEDAGIESNLCARLGNNGNLGDGTHDGDIGGGQLLNACVIFEILTGMDCREVDYAPVYGTYTLDDTLLSAIREAAHKAVTEIRPTYPENQAS